MISIYKRGLVARWSQQSLSSTPQHCRCTYPRVSWFITFAQFTLYSINTWVARSLSAAINNRGRDTGKLPPYPLSDSPFS